MIKNNYYQFLMLLIASLWILIPDANAYQCTKSNGAGVVAPCDVSFVANPSFSAVCVNGFDSRIFTIRNNTPVTLAINYIRIQNNDGLPDSFVTIDPIVANPCGSSLASGATCNIKVDVMPTTLGTLNRVLQVGINSRVVEIDATPINFPICANPNTIPDLDVPPDFSLLTIFGTTAINAGGVLGAGVVVTGDIGTSTGTTITGFLNNGTGAGLVITIPGNLLVLGQTHANDAIAQRAKIAIDYVDNQLAALPCDFNLVGETQITQTLINDNGPGVYCFDAGQDITIPAINLNLVNPLLSPSFYVFKIDGNLINNSLGITLGTGIIANNVYYHVAGDITFDAAAIGAGIYIGGSGGLSTIDFNLDAAIVAGRVFNRNGDVALNANVITRPTIL